MKWPPHKIKLFFNNKVPRDWRDVPNIIKFILRPSTHVSKVSKWFFIMYRTVAFIVGRDDVDGSVNWQWITTFETVHLDFEEYWCVIVHNHEYRSCMPCLFHYCFIIFVWDTYTVWIFFVVCICLWWLVQFGWNKNKRCLT